MPALLSQRDCVGNACSPRPRHVRALRSRPLSHGQQIGNLTLRRNCIKKNLCRRNVRAASDASSSGRDHSTWGALREELVLVLADLDANSTVLRIQCIVDVYSILLGCEGKVLAEACSHIARCEHGAIR